MMNRLFSGFYVILVIGFVFQCSEQTTKQDDTIPKDPGHIGVTLTYDSLPGYYSPAQLEYEVEVIEDNGGFVVTEDTLRYLTLWYHYNTENIEGTNAWSDTVWSQQVTIGQQIQLNPEFQLTQWSEDGSIWYSIVLNYAWSSANIPDSSTAKDNMWGHWTLVYNPVEDSVKIGSNI